MSILYPGQRGRRIPRTSRLAFMWDARDRSLIARSGQVGVLAATGASTSGGVITPGTGPATVQAGRAQPRFGSVAGAALLDLTGVDAGKDVEYLSFPFALGPCSLTLLLTLTPTWALGASRATAHYAFGLGDTGVGNTSWKVYRGGAAATSWAIQRSMGTLHTATVLESASQTAPLDILVTYDHATGIDTISVRGANGTITGPSASAAMAVNTLRWSGDVLALGSDAAAKLGAPIRLHRCKLAIGVKTFADMDGAW